MTERRGIEALEQILEKLVELTNENLDKRDGMSMFNVKSINTAKNQITSEIERLIGERELTKERLLENCQRHSKEIGNLRIVFKKQRKKFSTLKKDYDENEKDLQDVILSHLVRIEDLEKELQELNKAYDIMEKSYEKELRKYRNENI